MGTHRKKLIVMIVLLCVPLLYLVEEHLRGGWALAAWEKEAGVRGEKFAVADLAPKISGGEKNGAVNFPTASRPLSTTSALYAVITHKFIVPGKALGVLSVTGWPGIFKIDANSTGPVLNWEAAAAELSTNAAFIQQVRTAVQREELGFNLNYGDGFSMHVSNLATMKSSAQWLAASALVELHAGRHDAALALLLDGAALPRLQKEEPLLISQLVRHACVVIALSATWQALQAPGWTEPQLAQLQHAWEGWQLPEGMLAALVMERALVRVEFDRCRRDPRRLVDMLESMSGGSSPPSGGLWDMFNTAVEPIRSGLRRNVYGPLWSFAWADQDEARYLQRSQPLLDQARLAASSKSLTAGKLSAGEAEPDIFNFPGAHSKSFRHPLSSLVEVDGLVKSIAKAFRTDTQRELAVAGIALKRYQLRHGKFPASLDQLVPDFLTQLPRDYMNGEPLHYRLKEDCTFVLYSVGDDLKDNGGDPTPANPDAKPNQLNGRDIVWPWPASEEEIGAYVIRGGKASKK